MKRSVFVAILLGIGTLAFAAIAYAQTPFGTVVGTVKDKTGAIISRAAVTVRNEATGLLRETVTDKIGDYHIPSLPPGSYSIEARSPGFRTTRLTQVALDVGQIARVDLTLEVGPVTEEVTVRSEAVLLEKESSSVGAVIPNRMILDLPLNMRSFDDLITLAPATIHEPTAGLGVRVASGVSVAGARGSSNNFRLDGSDQTNNNVNLPAINMSLDAIQEFKVLESTFSAEYGHGAGIINVISKSGGNEIHGTVYEFLRNDALDATAYFTKAAGKPKSVLRYNQFGASVGGPLKKNTAFWFANYEGIRERRGTTNFMMVPEPAWLGLTSTGDADFSDLLPGSLTCGGPGQPACRLIYDPLAQGCSILDGFANCFQPFTGNIVPAARVNDFAKIFRQFIPAPNTVPTADSPFNYIDQTVNSNRNDQFTVRLDYKLGPKDDLFARYSLQDFDLLSPGVIPGNGERLPSRQQNVVLAWNRIQSDRLLNEFRFGFMRLANSRVSDIAGPDPQWARDVFGFVGATYTRGSSPPAVWLDGFISQSGIGFVSAFGSPLVGSDLTQANNAFDFTDNVTIIKGKHTIKAGADIRHVQFGVGQGDFQNGFFGFLNIGPVAWNTNFPVSDFVLGFPTFAEIGQVNPVTGVATLGISNFWQFFFQDDWKITPRLTLNLGVRYEYNSPPTVAGNRQSILDVNDVGEGRFLIANTRDVYLSAPDAFLPCTNGVDCGVISNVLAKPMGHMLLDRDRNNWSPRIGFSWSPLDRTVIRGGFGIFYDSEMLNDTLFVMQSPPFFTHPFLELPGNGVSFGFLSPIWCSLGIGPCPGANAIPINPLLFPLPGQGPSAAGRTINPHNRTPYFGRYSFSVQRELAPNLLLEVGYVGTQGHKLQRRRYVNQKRLDGTNLYPRLSTRLQYTDNVGNSNYNAMTVKVEKRYSYGLSMLASYTWSHAIDDVSFNIGGFEQNTWDLKAERATSDRDSRHRVVVGYSYELPIGRGKKFLSDVSSGWNQLVGGWQIGGVTQFQSGFPMNVVINSPPVGDPAGVGAGVLRPDCVGPIQLLDIRANNGRYVTSSAFAVPAPKTFGNCPRNVLPGPGINNFDFSLFKNFSFGDRYRLQFRAEFFNLFNHTQFLNTGNTNIQQPAFGLITETRAPREIQLGLKFSF